MDRRSFLRASSALAGLGLAGCARKVPVYTATAPSPLPGSPLPFYDALAPIPPIRAHVDRIFRVTVCLRPFRAAGPRMDTEKLGDKLIVHNYGHGGSGWSLSWGSADVAVRKVLEAGVKEAAVIGCGALGLTAALTAQRMGLRVTIYAKERPPFVRSARATGSWTPDSRIALTSEAPATFPAQWEAMARTSFAMYQSYLGMPGNPIEWTDRYTLSDDSPADAAAPAVTTQRHEFAVYRDRIADLTPRGQDIPSGMHPFPVKHVRRNTSLTFNVADYSRQLMNDFFVAGGTMETREFHAPQDLAALPQQVVVSCTGYGARQLWSDESVIPVRGQIAWLIPQEGVNYGLLYGNLYVLGRRDGIVVQPSPQGEETGWNDSNEQPDRAEAEAGVRDLLALYARMEHAKLPKS
jgi:glycine/D-amino acid oxidase-like deaminating enzyme